MAQSCRPRRAGRWLLSSGFGVKKRKGSVFRFAGKRIYLPILELLPPPTLGERRHRAFARRLVAVGSRPARYRCPFASLAPDQRAGFLASRSIIYSLRLLQVRHEQAVRHSLLKVPPPPRLQGSRLPTSRPQPF